LLPSRTTIHIQPPIPLSQHTHNFSQIISQSPDSIILQILGQDKPIIVKSTADIVLGRFSPGDPSPTVDLTPYHAGLMGVSRQHAIIKRDSPGYFIQDIGSTNGTWINEEKLIPYKSYSIRSGDLIRLGQLGINVYFSSENVTHSSKSSPVTLTLESEIKDHFKAGIALENLESYILAYLKAVTGIQEVLNQLLLIDGPEILLQEVSVNDTDSTIDIKLTGARQAIDLLKDKAVHRREVNADTLAQLNPDPADSEQDTLLQPKNNSKSGHLQKQLLETELEITEKLLESVVPHFSRDKHKPYVDKLLPHVHIVTSIPLRLSNR
jgi:pSer/pThr/pTyr-binding forkhead associated (FHA) protein